jgi:hypothetical protein
MDRATLDYVMLMFIFSIVLITLVLWEVEKVKHRRAVRRGRRISAGIEDAEAEQVEDDPYDVGMNDKDIL